MSAPRLVPPNNEGGSRKRVANDAHMRYSQKRPKRSSPVNLTAQAVQLVYVYDNFRFLELPAELRNHIYEIATEDAFRCFPSYLFRNMKIFKGAKSPEPPLRSRRSIPYFALTQTCMQIRAEFRPMWLSTHKMPLNLMTPYLKVFFPMRLPKNTRFKPLTLSTPKLRISIRKDEMDHSHLDDVTRLIKHKARFPGSVITCQSIPYWNEDILPNLERVINHSDVAWMHSVSKGRISQIRLGIDTAFDPRGSQVAVDIVVKERFAEPWMRATLHAPPQGELNRFLEGLGFAPGSMKWRVKVYVDYS